MIEVFRTNVKDSQHADILVTKIQGLYSEYSANFDLEDCDKILRVSSSSGCIEVSPLIKLMNRCGFKAEVLADTLPDNQVSMGTITFKAL